MSPFTTTNGTRHRALAATVAVVALTALGGCASTGPSAGAADASSSPAPSTAPTLIGTYEEGYDAGYAAGSAKGARASADFLADRTEAYGNGYDAGYTQGTSEAQAAESNPITAFGKTMTWEDGLALTVTSDGTFTPGRWAATDPFPAYTTFTFTVTNGTSTTWTPSAYANITSAGAEGDEVFDSDQGYGGGPSSPVLPGQTLTWKQGFGVQDPADLTLSVTVDYSHVDVVYTTHESAWTF